MNKNKDDSDFMEPSWADLNRSTVGATQFQIDVLFMSLQLKKFLGYQPGQQFDQKQNLEKKLLSPYAFRSGDKTISNTFLEDQTVVYSLGELLR